MKNREDFQEYIKAFLEQNSYLNLISKNDEKFLWEKHIFDSLAIEKFFEKYFFAAKQLRSQAAKLDNRETLKEQLTDKNLSTFQPFNLSTNNNFPLSTFHFQLLDIGTGGGFPAVPIAIMYPEIEVFALDSIRKKINAIENIKAELKINNLYTICNRAENIKNQKFNIITSRAVAPIKVIVEYAMPLLKDDGYFIAYKSIKAQEEIEDAKHVLKKHKAKVVDIIRYDLPLDENFTRNLVVIAK